MMTHPLTTQLTPPTKLPPCHGGVGGVLAHARRQANATTGLDQFQWLLIQAVAEAQLTQLTQPAESANV